MGLNVIVSTLNGKQHPEWDDGKYEGDRSLFGIADAIDRIDHIIDPGYGGANDWFWRPTDFAEFRAAPWPSANAERWKLLADILERDNEYWVFLSV